MRKDGCTSIQLEITLNPFALEKGVTPGMDFLLNGADSYINCDLLYLLSNDMNKVYS